MTYSWQKYIKKNVKLNVKIIVNNSQDGAEDGSRVACSGKICSFSYVLFVFLLFYVLDVVSITVYDRGHAFEHWFLRRATQTGLWVFECRWTVHRRCARISYQRETRDCCVICLTETWMSAIVPDSAIELTGFSVHRSDRTKELTGKSREAGVFVSILTTCGVMKGRTTLY